MMGDSDTPAFIEFHCLSTKQKFKKENPEIIKTSHGRHFYVAESPYATHSKKTGLPLGKMYRAVGKANLPQVAREEASGSGVGPV